MLTAATTSSFGAAASRAIDYDHRHCRPPRRRPSRPTGCTLPVDSRYLRGRL